MSVYNQGRETMTQEEKNKMNQLYKNRNLQQARIQYEKEHGITLGPNDELELIENGVNSEYHTPLFKWVLKKNKNSQGKGETGVGVGVRIPLAQQRQEENSLLEQLPTTLPIGQPSSHGIGNSAAGVLTLQQQRQQSPRPTTFYNLEVPAHLVPQRQPHVIDPNTNSLIQQLKPNTLLKVKNGLNKIKNQSKKNTAIGKIKTESIKITGELSNNNKDEIEKGILEILGGSKTEEAVKKRPNILFIVIIVLLVVGGIVAVIILVAVPKINEKMAEIRKDWPENRCKYPYVNLPSVFGPEGTTADENKAYCDSQAANSAFNSNIGGIQNQIDSQNNSIQNNTESLNNTQTMILGMRDALMKQVNDIYQKMYGMFKRIAYLFKVFARLFYRIFETFNSLFKTIKYAVWTLMSVWEGPIGGLVRAFCFGCHTLIELDGKIKRLDEIIIGDNISGDVVVGVCEFKKDAQDQYYKIGDVYVSGMHIVEHDGEFIRVHSHPRAVIVDYNLPVIRCLITDTGRLRIGGTIYCDYLGDNVLETYLKIVAPIVKIPFRLDDYKNSALNLYPAFTQDSIIQVDSGIKMITDIVIGDKIAGKEVIGVIRYILEGKTFITEYDDGYNMCKFVGIQICRGNKYVVRENHREMKILGKLECIGLVVEGGVIELSRNMRIVDFDIIGDDMRRDVEDALEKLYLD